RPGRAGPGRPIRRRAAVATRRAMLYVHGYADYFFQTHLADFWVEQGYDFYAVDLRKNGRSWLSHQTLAYVRHLGEYAADLDATYALITADGHDSVILNAHSTGGLIAAMWAHARRDRRDGRGILDAMLLNSPFFQLPVPPALRGRGGDWIEALGRTRPMAVIPSLHRTPYSESVHADYYGEWQFDLRWKPIVGVPLRAGWLRAVRVAQRQLHGGLEVPCPVLVAASTAYVITRGWDESLLTADAVLDVEQTARWAPKVGPLVTVQRIAGGLHDLALSPKPARERYFQALSRWLRAYGPKENA
ncbi:alpha/beta hydrolase, partial [Fodinicola feengrottensis]|uniref:alpha/beta hydrolase n=1 Tax=Fodinicola feengrottensis TaxID=435914 RepID=UPI0013CFE1F1